MNGVTPDKGFLPTKPLFTAHAGARPGKRQTLMQRNLALGVVMKTESH